MKAKRVRYLITLVTEPPGATISDHAATRFAFATDLPDGRVLWERGCVTEDQLYRAVRRYLTPEVVA